jgi:hypothetical protein
MVPRTIYFGFLLFWFAAPQSSNSPGSLPTYEAGREPACDQARRGSMILSLGTAGHSDNMEVCLRDGAGRFAWVPASYENRNSFAKSRKIGGCPVFPDNNVWSSTVDKLPVSGESAAIINTYTASRLGVNPEYSLNLADSKTPAFTVRFGASESDFGKYPITGNMLMEGPTRQSLVSKGPYKASDAHLMVLQTDQCKLYEIYSLETNAPPYSGGSGAIYDLMANDMRPDGWTSADAAGLPIWPGVLTYGEVYGEGEIRHMVRFSVNSTRNSYIWPARHYASRKGEPTIPPMGARWRLKASVDENTCHESDNNGKSYPAEMKRLIRALKHYGMILADNGLAIRISADTDARWGDPTNSSSPEYVFNGWTHCLSGRDFEMVDSAALMVGGNSAEAVQY